MPTHWPHATKRSIETLLADALSLSRVLLCASPSGTSLPDTGETAPPSTRHAEPHWILIVRLARLWPEFHKGCRAVGGMPSQRGSWGSFRVCRGVEKSGASVPG